MVMVRSCLRMRSLRLRLDVAAAATTHSLRSSPWLHISAYVGGVEDAGDIWTVLGSLGFGRCVPVYSCVAARCAPLLLGCWFDTGHAFHFLCFPALGFAILLSLCFTLYTIRAFISAQLSMSLRLASCDDYYDSMTLTTHLYITTRISIHSHHAVDVVALTCSALRPRLICNIASLLPLCRRFMQFMPYALSRIAPQ